MANKRNYEWALASVIDGFFTQDKAGGVTQRVPFSLIVSSLQGQNVFQPQGDDLTAIEAISGTGVLTRTGTNTWVVVSSVAPTAHASTHQTGGGDALAGQSIVGLRVTDSVEFTGLTLRGNVLVKQDTSISSNSTDGNEQTALSLCGGGAAGSDRGAYIMVRGNERPGSGGSMTLAAGDGIQGNIDLQTGGATRLQITKAGAINALVAVQMNGVDAITSARAGRLTGLRLTNLTIGQIPVCSDGNGEITASGQTDDGTYLTSNRIFRAWNSITKSGDTWTDLQWTQDPNERVSIFGANVAGADGFHSIVLAPYDTETTGRFLGIIHWGQKLSGKSGTAPGLKAEMLAESIGAGGSVGGFGARMRFRYRPDNGATLVDALRVGAFGGSAVDAVETAILLRAAAGAKVAGDFVLDSTPAAGATAGDILQRDLNGRLTKATPNVFYLSAYFPESTGTSTVDITKHRSASHSGSWTLDDFTVKFHRQTGTGTLSLPAASATYEGREYKITFHGRFNFTVSVASGSIYSLAAGASYWYNVASSTVSAGDASGDNCSCDLWCDGSNWYIRW